jgi:hypothetical protein
VGSYLSVLSPSEACVGLKGIRKRLADEAFDAAVVVADGDESNWRHLEVSAASDKRALFDVFRHVVQKKGDDDHIESHLESIIGEKPASAARWLVDYMKRVRTIYTLEVLDIGAEGESEDWAIVWATQGAIVESAGGILQADGEGYSNDAQDHILWQFDEGATGTWRMAVLDERQRWQRFEMDLSDAAARAAFLAGRVPEGVKRL